MGAGYGTPAPESRMSSAERNASVATGPVVEVVLDEFGHGSVDGTRVPALDPADPRGTLLAEVTRRAATLGRPLRVRALDPDGVWHLVAHTDGSVTEQDAADDAHSACEPPAASHR